MTRLTRTSTDSKTLTDQELDLAAALIGHLMKRYQLTHWRWQISKTTPTIEGALYEVVTHRDRNCATFRISREGWNHADRERLLKHEVLHVLVDPLREEHDIQVESLPSERRAEYSKRMMRHIERLVEHLSYVM